MRRDWREKISLKKGSSAVNYRPGPNRVRTQRTYEWQERPISWRAALRCCQLNIGQYTAY